MQNLQGKANLEECIEAAATPFIEPAFHTYVGEIFASTTTLEKIIDDIPEDPVTKRLDEAEKTYIEQVTEVDIALEKIRKIETDIDRCSISLVAITDQGTAPNGITDLTDRFVVTRKNSPR